MAADKEIERLRSVIAVLERELAGMQSIAELRAQERDEMRKERDKLMELVARQRAELENLSLSGDESAASEHYWQCADAIEPYVHFGPPPMEQGALSNSVVESMEFLLQLWVDAGRPESAAQLKTEWQAEAIDKWSQTIIQLADYTVAKNKADPNYPGVNYAWVWHLCVDMDDDADRLRQGAESQL